jgi:small GTP-binding protein
MKLKIILAGNPAVGKTSLIHRFVKNRFAANYKLTFDVDIYTKDVELKSGKIADLSIWDIGGQERFEFVRPSFYRGASGALLVFDLTRDLTFLDSKKWLTEIRQFAGRDLPFVLIGNKADLTELISVDKDEVRTFAESEESIYIETSAKTGVNVNDAFFKLTRKILGPQLNSFVELKHISNSIKQKEMSPIQNSNMIEVWNEFEDLLNIQVEKILLSKPQENRDLRFLIIGNEEVQKPLLSKLFRVEEIEWPPKALSLLYNTLSYKMSIDSRDHVFEIFFLSNLKNLNKKNDLFIKSCSNSNGVIIFYDPHDEVDFKNAVNTSKTLRKQFENLEIILTTGSEEPFTAYQVLERLEKKYQINNYNDYESLLSIMLINILKRKKKFDQTKKYLQFELKKLQDQLNEQQIIPNQMKQDIIELANSINKYNIPKTETSVEDFGKTENLIEKSKIFISYAFDDTEKFQIPKVAELLEGYNDIDKVLYWEKDSDMDIIEYMDKNLTQCQSLILFCSESIKNSEAVKAEWHAFFYKGLKIKDLKIIPVFEKLSDIPTLLGPYMHIEYNSSDFENFIENLHRNIMDFS